MAKATQQLARATAIVGSAMIASRVLGFLRNSVLAALFGQGTTTDAFNAAFLVPDTIYLILIGGGISSAFIPVLSRYIATGQEDESWRVASIAFNAVAVAMACVLTAGYFTAPWFVHLLFPGFGPAKLALTVALTRITMISIFFHSLNGILVGTEYAHNSFLMTALGPLAYNAAIIAVGIALSQWLGIFAFAWATLAAAVVNFFMQLWGVLRLSPRYFWSLRLDHPGIRRIAELVVPVAIGLSIAQINLLVPPFFASSLAKGSLNAYYLATRVMLVPVLFATSIGITLLPNLSRQAAAADHVGFRSTFSQALRAVVFIAVPASVALLLLAEPAVRALFQHGEFSRHATLVTASALAYFTVGIAAYSAYEIISRAFYAVEDTKTPVKVGILSIVAGVLMNIVFLHLFANAPGWGGVRGLALAYSLTGVINALVLLAALRRRLGPLHGRKTARTAVRSAIASVPMAVAIELALLLIRDLPSTLGVVHDLLVLLLPICMGAVSYIWTSRLLGAEEVHWLSRVVRARLRRA